MATDSILRTSEKAGRVHAIGILVFLVVAALMGTASSLHAATVTALWNANPEPDIAGYKLSYGTATGVYTTTVDVGNVTSSVLTGLTPATRYFFVVQAYNTGGLTSANSAEVFFDVPAAPIITSLSPTSGLVTTLVTIAGSNFGAPQGTSTVTFNGTSATPSTWSATSILVPVPAGATTGNVVVTVGGLASNGVPFTVTAVCTFTLSAASASVGAAASSGSVNVTASTSTCTWTSTSNASWITITAGASGTGNGTVSYSVAANGKSTARTGTITIKGLAYSVVQSGLVFTDDPIIPGTTLIKAVHITELRSRIDAIRVAKGLAPYAWSDPSLTAGATSIRAQHIVDLRAALAQAYVAAGLSPPTYTDPVIGSGTTVKVAHIANIRSAVIAIE